MISRTSNSVLGRWWWTVDKVILFFALTLIAFGVLLAGAATPMVAKHLGISKFYFLNRHLLYLIPSLFTLFFVSLFSDSDLKKLSILLFVMSIFTMLLTLTVGHEIKGARRWVSLFGLSLQPSEFARPALTIITAWMFAERQKHPEFRGIFLASIPLFLFIMLLIFQPDIGMIIVTFAVWFAQLFINGLPLIWAIGAVGAGVGGFILSYLFLPHVAARVDRFLDPAAGDHYQINRSLESFAKGGLFGVGPGEGITKKHLPDAHSDFVFAVLGEEFGFIVCLFVILLIASLVIYGLIKTVKSNNLFGMLASAGLVTHFGLQSFINIGSSLHLIPTKGTSLPFLSYGGSSLLSNSIVLGMLLALRRNRTISLGIDVVIQDWRDPPPTRTHHPAGLVVDNKKTL
ncbi:MAG: putative lipid II flippase FtsW [Holosporaceae bacterium]|jgi:cell division protein FtsW|nr:putative lipid II flippase FtsW [Holosporaceae bacterium]